MTRMFKSLGGAAAVLAAVLVLNLLRLPAPPQWHAAPLPALPVDAEAAAERLGQAVRFATISARLGEPQTEAAFVSFAAWLQRSYPRVFERLEAERVGAHSWLLRWPGREAGPAAALVMGHIDVVPVEPGTEARWEQPPFSGAIADGFVWGRGTLDDKSGALGWLEAIDALIAAGFVPRRDVYVALGHDEEVGGRDGAARIARLLRARGVQAEVAIDEGGAITRGVVAGIDAPVASIMGAEKGYVSLRLVATADGGHSSTPPQPTAYGRLARAVARLEREQMPRHLAPPVADMLRLLAPELPLGARLALANRWLLEDLLLGQLGRTRVGNALTRTTTAPTMFSPGVKDNVLPSEAWAVVNFRILPGDSVAAVRAHVESVIDDPLVRVEPYSQFASEPSPVSPPDTEAFAAIAASVREVLPEARITTGIVVGATDLRHYAGIHRHRYNFSPVLLTAQDIPRIHGTNERIGVADYARMIDIKTRILRRLAGGA